jgi:hypothetical protein
MEPNNPAYSVGTTLVFPVEEILVTGFAPAGWDIPLFDAHPMSIIIFGDENRGDDPDFSLLTASLGFRILKGGPIATARSRMNELVDVDAILVRCTGTEPELNDALARFDMMAQTHGTRLIVIVGLDGLDAVISVISSADATILCQPDFADIVVALMGAQSRAGTGDLLRDIGSGDGDARLEHLSSQIARLNQTIETLVRNKFVDRPPPSLEMAQQESSLRSAGRGYAPMPNGNDADRPALTSHQIRSLLRARRLRDQLVVADLFADPAWDIMRSEERRVGKECRRLCRSRWSPYH